MNDKDRIVEAVCRALDKLDELSVSDWTKEVKTALCNACCEAFKGSGQQVKLFASGVGTAADGGEWLFDVTCLLNDDKGYIKSIPLVAESEWRGRNDVVDDFEKLLVARADVCVMIFDRNYWDSAEQAIAELKAYVTACERSEPDDIFLLAAWTRDGFEYCQIAGGGAARRL